MEAYEKAQAAAPNFSIVHTNLAIALTEMGTHAKMAGACIKSGPPSGDSVNSRLHPQLQTAVRPSRHMLVAL